MTGQREVGDQSEEASSQWVRSGLSKKMIGQSEEASVQWVRSGLSKEMTGHSEEAGSVSK